MVANIASGNPVVSILTPAYNSAAFIAETIESVLQQTWSDFELLIIDDGSTDGTRDFLTQLQAHIATVAQSGSPAPFGRLSKVDNIRVVFQDKNCGKGAALRRGFEEARGEVIVIQDADLELNPEEYPKLLGPIERGVADVVYGSRFLGRSRQNQPFSYYMGNRVLTAVSNALTGLKLTDVWTGYKMFRREVLQNVRLRENRFGFEPEITAKIARIGCRVSEVAVSYTCRGRDEGKKIGWKDSVRGMWCTLRYSLLPDPPQ